MSPLLVTYIISIHALREEGDWYAEIRISARFGFLSTPSARRATDFVLVDVVQLIISIHALREEGDQHRHSPGIPCERFLSTPSARRATIRIQRAAPQKRFLSTPSARRATHDRFHLWSA